MKGKIHAPWTGGSRIAVRELAWASTFGGPWLEKLGHFDTGDFDAMLVHLGKYVGELASDKIATHLLGHTRTFLELQPPDWKGIIKFNEK